jgi:hypothetical protein
VPAYEQTQPYEPSSIERPPARGRVAPPAVIVPRQPAVAPPPTPGQPRHKAPRDRYDWRITRHAAQPVELVDERPRYLATLGWTAAWYAVPVALFAAWTLTFPASPGPACARPTGGTCPSPRSLALTTLVHSFPRVGAALGIALVIAALIRLGSTAWRPITVGFSAAVIGAGSATVLLSVLTSTT